MFSGCIIFPIQYPARVTQPHPGKPKPTSFTQRSQYHEQNSPPIRVCLRATASDKCPPPPPPPLIFGINTAHAQTNTAPTANAGADQSVTTGTEVTLDGSGSSDPDTGDTWTYAWTQTSGTDVTLSDTVAEMPTFTAPDSAAVLVFTLTVTDVAGATNTDTVTITVNPVADTTPPGVRFVAPRTGVVGVAQEHNITFTEAVTGLEVGDFNASGATVDSIDPAVGPARTYTITFTPTAATLNLTLNRNTVMDLGGNEGPTGSVTVSGTATVDTTAPTATFGTLDAGVIGTQQSVGLTFSETVTGLSADDITAVGATVDGVSGNGTAYMVAFTPTLAAFTLTLAAGSVIDVVSNPNPEASVSGTTTPAIALAADTGISPSDRITNNGVVNVSGLAPGATWKYVTDGGSTFTTGTGSSFTLPENVYDADDVQVVQTVSGADSAAALLGAVTVDTTAPTVASRSAIATGEVNTPQEQTVTFSEPVTGFDASALRAPFVFGLKVDSVIDSGDQTTYVITFTPTGTVIVLNIQSNIVADLAGNQGPVAASSGGGSAVADTSAPTVTTFVDPAEGEIGTRQSVNLTFSETVTGLAADDFSASTGVTGTSVSGSGSTYTITFTPTAATFTLTLAANSVMDTTATPNAGPASAASVDGTATPAIAPTVTTFVDPAEGEIGTQQSVNLTFSETVTGLAADDFSASTGVTGTSVSGSGSTYTITFTPTAATFTLTLAANSVMDTTATPNAGPASAASVDGTATPAIAPTVTTFVDPAEGEIGTQQSVNLTFSETVTGLAADDFSASTGVTGTSVSGSGSTYTITFTPTAATFTLTLAANSVEDSASIPNTGPASAESVDGTAVDTTAPTVDWGTIAAGVVGTAQTHDLTFSEAVTGLAADDFSASTGVTGTSVSGSGSTYSITFTPSETSFTLILAADSVEDTASTPNAGPASAASVTGSATPAVAPTVDLGTIAAGVVGTAQTHDITFSEAVTGLAADDFSASTGVTGTSVSGSGSTYTITFTPSETSFTLTLAANSVEDTAATPNAGPASAASVTGTAVPADPTALTATFGAVTIGAVGTQQSVGLSFDEAVTGLAADDFSASTGVTGTSVSGSGDTYSITFTPNAAAFTLTLAADSVMDTAATPNTGPETAASVTGSATSATVTDMTAPTATFGTIAAGVIDRQQTISLTFSEAVTGLAATDITATGATVDSVSGSGSTYTIAFTPTASAFTLTLAANSVEDTAATPNPGPAAAVSATGTAVDATAPEITLLGASPLEVNQGSTFTDPGATASDDVDADLSASIAVGGDLVDTATAGDYTITYDVSDAAGNAADTVTRIVRVVIARDLAKLNEVILPEVARAMADQHVSAIVRRLEQARRANIAGAAASSSFGGAGNLTELIKAQGRALVYDQFDWKRVLAGSAFVLPLNGAGGGAAEKAQDFTLWGAGDYRSIEGADGVRWDGDLFSLQLGLDARLNERTILGVSVSKSQARLDYTDPSLAVSGDYDLDMTSVHPYLGWVAGGMDFWATLGYGDGELEISEDRALGEAIPASDLSMQTLALGASGILMETGLTTLRLKGEAMSSTVELDGNEQITAVTRDASRLRMTLEASRTQALDSGAQFESSLEAGLRYDGGDGETGAGAELGASLRYASLGGGLVIEGKARALVGGEAEEWGLSGLVKFASSTAGRGLSFSLTPGYGVTTGGVQQLWQQGLNDGLGGASHGASNEYSPRLKVRLDYGMHALRGPGLMTPYTELSLGDKNTYRLGLQWQRSKLFDLKLVAERKEGTTAIDHRIYLVGEIAL